MSLSEVSQQKLRASGLSDDDEESKEGSSLVDQSSGSGTGSHNGSTTDTNQSGRRSEDDPENIKNAITKKESRQVFRLRIVVVLILVAAAASISFAIYYITRNAEIDTFEQQYSAVADKIIDSFQRVLVEMSAVSGIAVAATAETQMHYSENGDAIESEAGTWPFVTISNFQERGGNAQTLSGALYISISPIVEAEELADWERYVLSGANSWIEEGIAYQEQLGLNGFVDSEQVAASWLTHSSVDPLHSFDGSGKAVLSAADGPFLPQWQTFPVLQTSQVNVNLFEDLATSQPARDCIASKSAVLGGFVHGPPGPTTHPDRTTAFFATLRSMYEGKQAEYLGDPMSHLFIPIYETLIGFDREVVAVLKSTIHWRAYMRNLLDKNSHGVNVVVENACDGNFTYYLDGTEAYVVGFGDKHDRTFSDYEITGKFLTDVLDDGTMEGIPFNQLGCPYTFHVYPTQEYLDHYTTSAPIIISLSVAAVFLFAIAMFFVYDHLVERRQKMVLAKATQSTAIVSSLFPRQVRDRLLAIESDKRKSDAMVAPNHKLKSFLSGNSGEHASEQPIADFFPRCTVLFADIAGFTAWSSSREPAQVFLLLQTVYSAFDSIAKRRRVFKVETIGDSYVAVTGLPEPQSHHASIMARFAWDCLIRIGEVTKELEVSLGPDTGDLSMRFGLHSGAVTAGVLKGDRARFQLFGDTVNTAARMESTGMKGRIHVSESTAQILKSAGKEGWLTKREDAVVAKGKGVLTTYWLAIKTGIRTSSSAASADEFVDRVEEPGKSMTIDDANRISLKQTRLIDWITDILTENIKKIVIIHQRCGKGAMVNDDLRYESPEGMICLDEVQGAISMPKFDAKVADAALDSRTIEIPYDILEALREYVGMIAGAYRDNPFHNFEHACHVTMSVNKLLSRIVTPDLASPLDSGSTRKDLKDVAAEIHNFTHGLTSDPMAVFSIVFSALIHDVDHQGVSNAQLIKEEPEMAKHYRNKSVAEQNSLDVAWDMLMQERFDKLRKYIFETNAELMRFRQLIVNVVLATDIFDKELGQLRKDRWQRAFHGGGNLSDEVVNDLRATIVLEHIIQASDVSHTMQHWHVYQKWNRKLFAEMYRAFKAGRMGSDPSAFWYQGELGFFDNYVIPLAKKLKECNVFGVSSDEYLGYAERNRSEWAERGEEILSKMIEELEGGSDQTKGGLDRSSYLTGESVKATDTASSTSSTRNGDDDMV